MNEFASSLAGTSQFIHSFVYFFCQRPNCAHVVEDLSHSCAFPSWVHDFFMTFLFTIWLLDSSFLNVDLRLALSGHCTDVLRAHETKSHV